MAVNKRSNRIIVRLISGGIIDISALKHYYRELCKETHPDLNTGGAGESFIRLQQEYDEAMDFVLKFEKQIPSYKTQKMKFRKQFNPRMELYDALRYYNASGLHSVRIRNKESLKGRNKKIIKDVLFWARWYDKNFIPIFIEYNKLFLRPLIHGEIEKRLKLAKDRFRRGLSMFLDYQVLGSPNAKRSAASFMGDVIYELKNIDPGFYNPSLLRFAYWVEKELEFPSACKRTGNL